MSQNQGDLVPVQTRPLPRKILKIFKYFQMNRRLPSWIKLKNLMAALPSRHLPPAFQFFHFNDKMGIILRIVRNAIPTIEQLQLPSIVGEIALTSMV